MVRRQFVWMAALAVVLAAFGCRSISSPAGGQAEEPAPTVAAQPAVGAVESSLFKDTRPRPLKGYDEPNRVATPSDCNPPPEEVVSARPASARMRAVVAAAESDMEIGVHKKPGFETVLKDGRLWVFPAGSSEYSSFLGGTEPAKNVTMVRSGPGGVSLRGIEKDHLLAYIAARPGFEVRVQDGRIWVFEPGSRDLRDFETMGEPAKHVIRPGAGPRKMTVKAPSTEVLMRYLAWKPGYVTHLKDGRLWVFEEGSQALASFEAGSEPAKNVTLVKAGPGGISLRGVDKDVLWDYVAAAEGFETRVVDRRVWVFLPGSDELRDYETKGEPAKYVTRPSAGPMRMTVKAPDTDTIASYLRQVMP